MLIAHLMKDLMAVCLWESEPFGLGKSIPGRWNSMHECLLWEFSDAFHTQHGGHRDESWINEGIGGYSDPLELWSPRKGIFLSPWMKWEPLKDSELSRGPNSVDLHFKEIHLAFGFNTKWREANLDVCWKKRVISRDDSKGFDLSNRDGGVAISWGKAGLEGSLFRTWVSN